MDGLTYVCEVKSSWRSLRSADLEAFAQLAARLKPDVAMLAIMEDSDARAASFASKRAQELKKRLSSDGVQFLLLTLKEAPLKDSPLL